MDLAETLAYLSGIFLMDYLLHEPRYLYLKFVWRIAQTFMRQHFVTHDMDLAETLAYLKDISKDIFG